MSFLRVNGWAIPLADGSPGEEHVLGGDFARAYSGNPISDERFDKRVWSGRTPPVTEMVAQAIKGAVRGLGHVWSYDSDLYSSKGLTPGATVGSRRIATAADGSAVVNFENFDESKFGAYSLTVEPAATNILAANKRNGTEDGTTTGFAAVAGGLITSQTTQKVQGTRSLRVVTGASADGAETTTETAAATTAYAGSAYVWSPVARQVVLELIDSVGSVASYTGGLFAGRWTRLVVTGTTAGGATTIKLRFKDNAGGGSTFYLDQLQIEAGTIATTWADPTRIAGDLAYSSSIVTGAVDLTVNFWARLPAANVAVDRTFLRIGPASGTANVLRIFRAADENDIHILTGSDDVLYATTPWNGAWHMVTCVVRQNAETGENQRTIYFDGTSVTTASGSAIDLSLATLLQVGHALGADRLGATTDSLMDDFMIVPYAAPAAQIAAWYAMAKAMPALSRVYVDGDAMPDDALTVLAEGKANSSKYLAAHSGGAFRQNLRLVNIELWEV